MFSSHLSQQQTAGTSLRIIKSTIHPLQPLRVAYVTDLAFIDIIFAATASIVPSQQDFFSHRGVHCFISLFFSPHNTPSLSLSLPLRPSPHPVLPPILLYLCTESAFQSSMPQACREAVHGLNYTPSDTQSTSYSLPPSLSVSICCSFSV